jgi:transcription elongation factor GreA
MGKLLDRKGVKRVMSTEKVFPMTAEGKEKLEKELENLKTVKRKEVVERIKIARSFGDLSENSEYDAAKDEQAFVEGRISTLENMIRNAKIIQEDDMNSDTVQLGKKVTFVELPDGDKETYTIVGSAEADPFEGKISNDSPIAKSLLGHKIGAEVNVQTPGGEMSVKIVEVS